MQYPLISEYVRAIQDASDNFGELAHLVPVLDDHGEPYRSSGAFAVVFKMRDEQTGKCYALKCFTEEQEGRAEAYRMIADELDCVDSSYVTSVKYLDKEIFVDSSCEEDEFPVLLMDWVEGETMETYIAANYQDEYDMAMLCYRFCKMAAWIRSQPFAHGDIKPDNIMVRPDGTLALVDYDGMFVPAMKGQKSPTIGTKDFSHPLRTIEDFDETIDDFALASIALSLKAISLKPSLLDEFGAADRLLFSADDYRDLSKSKVLVVLQELMCDKDFCTLFSLFMIAFSRENLSLCSFRLFIGSKPVQLYAIDILSTKVTIEELEEAIVDFRGVKYSKDGRKLLESLSFLAGSYSIKEGTKIICNSAFAMRRFPTGDSLTNIIIPSSVTSIGDGAFSNCSSLSRIIIPSSVTNLNGNPFSEWYGELECLSLHFKYEGHVLFNKEKTRIISYRTQNDSYTIPNGITSIGEGAFRGRKSLVNIVFPSCVTTISQHAFSGCSSLTSIVIPSSVKSIDSDAFSGCSSLTSIVIPSSVKSIGSDAFSGCSSLTNIVIPSSVTCISDGLFSNCSSLNRIVIPSSVKCIGARAFSNCSSLTNIIIPSSVTSIGSDAFSGCSSLTNIVIPSSVTNLNGNPFSKWNGELECLSPYFRYDDNVLFNKEKTKIISFRKNNVSYKIPSNVKCIGANAFSNCESLTSIVIPKSVTNIGAGAFSNCESLTSIAIPESVTNIGNSAFFDCESLTSIVLPYNLTDIGNWTFFSCRSLHSVELPSNLKNIGDSAFCGCSSLTSIVFPPNMVNIGKWAFCNCDSLTNVVIPTTVINVGFGAFCRCNLSLDDAVKEFVSRFGKKIFSGL